MVTLRKRLSVLLASASSGGTIAAARHLGDSGIKVSVLSSSRSYLSAASWSNHVTRSHVVPRESDNRQTPRIVCSLFLIPAITPIFNASDIP
jgi:hypothetical protein